MDRQILQILKWLSKKFELVVLVDKDGLPLMSFNPKTKKHIDPSMEIMVSGIAAAVLSLGKNTTSVLDHGELKHVVIENEKGLTIIADAGENVLLIGILPPIIGYETALASFKRAASKLAKLNITPSRTPSRPEELADIFVPEID